MGAYEDSVLDLQAGSITLLKSFVATDGAIDATYRGNDNGKGKKKGRYVVLFLGTHTEGEPAFQAKDALEYLGFFYDEKRDKSRGSDDVSTQKIPATATVKRD